jgi:parvulin-like peptidyl-prolyl isomerase
MAKKDKKKAPLGKIGRVERERRYNRGITFGTILVVSAVVIVIVVGVISEGFIRPSQPIAIVMGEEILTKDFQARVRFERGQLINQYLSIYQYMELFNSDPTIQSQYQTYLRQIQFQLEPSSVGSNALEIMIDEIIIKNEAQSRGIEVSDDEVEELFQTSFGYFPDGIPSPTTIPETAPASTLSATQLALVTLTPTPSNVPTTTPNTEGDPTPPPTATIPIPPTPTPEPYTFDNYEEDYQSYLDNLRNEFKVSEEDIRKIFTSRLLREKLREVITADLSIEEEQVWARHILVEEEETALDILDRFDDGEDWAALASEYSTDASNASQGGDLGWFNQSTMVPAFSEIAFTTSIGAVSDPVETDFGWHLIQVIGHEMRPLSSNEYEQLKESEFNNWLDQVRFTLDVEILEYWIDRIPEEPSIPAHLLLP